MAPCFVCSCPLRPPPVHLPPPSTLTSLSPRHRLSPHPFHCVRLLVIIIAAVNHLGCQAPFWLHHLCSNFFLVTQNHLKSPLSSCLSSLLPCHTLPTGICPPLPSLPPLSHPVWAARCVFVCVRGCGGFLRETGLPLCLCSDAGGHREGSPCQSVRSNLYPLIL